MGGETSGSVDIDRAADTWSWPKVAAEESTSPRPQVATAVAGACLRLKGQ